MGGTSKIIGLIGQSGIASVPTDWPKKELSPIGGDEPDRFTLSDLLEREAQAEKARQTAMGTTDPVSAESLMPIPTPTRAASQAAFTGIIGRALNA